MGVACYFLDPTIYVASRPIHAEVVFDLQLLILIYSLSCFPNIIKAYQHNMHSFLPYNDDLTRDHVN